ncbi:MAG: rRNA pseudouridine synthase [Alphaproteobacteria bacterium]|nr:rRNA pseudouridine synthase [Alphaproteobacteria bacterium]
MEQNTPKGERIAKVLARAGIASRREAERMIAAGRVAVNGAIIDSPALNVGPRDLIAVDGKEIAAAEPAKLWRYYKPNGLVTTERDEKGRRTVFESLPEDMPRVMSVGRLDLNSEGLLLLTNDGGLKRKLELPSTGWIRKYRVRVNGAPHDDQMAPLRKGIVLDGERFQPMQISIDRQQGANAWLTIGIREGKNREIRRAMEAVNLIVNRLIRVSYGPFQLGDMKPGAVEEIRPKALRDQLGIEIAEDKTPAKPRGPGRKIAPKSANTRAMDPSKSMRRPKRK